MMQWKIYWMKKLHLKNGMKEEGLVLMWQSKF